MMDILLVVIAVSIVIIVFFLVPLLIEAKRTFVSLRKTTEEKLNPALNELELNLKILRDISDDVNVVTSDIRKFSGSISDVAESLNMVTDSMVKIRSTTVLKIISLKVGIAAALGYLLTNVRKKGDNL
jgi:uncharacterized protein YoxC